MELVNEENTDELIKAQTHIRNETFHFIKSMSLKCAVQLGIPDTINSHGQPMTLSELVRALQVHPTKTHHLYCLMRVLVHSGFFNLQNASDNYSQKYVLTPASRLLLKDSSFDTRPFISLVLDPIMTEPYNSLTPFLRNDDLTPFVTAFGVTLWGYTGNEARANHLVNDCMASDSSVIGRAVIIKCKEVFEGLNSLVDVGGGTGNMAKAIAQTFPNLKCTVLDLPHVVDKLQGINNLSFLGGDMFQPVPPADAILLKWILHDWPDEECIKILKNCKEAISRKGKEGKVMIIGIVMGNQSPDDSLTELQLLFDMEMMVAAMGKERNEEEWKKLFFDAGFSNYKIYPVLGPRALIEVYP
ncbi:trans-resveratrol di-O-methyltransferase [Ricinus communis]|uniref:O-methyltransferase, putative n=1 Tax=Ricinus communis TaxID=3988 RepID=B9RVR6_RICCO|nr:trans-resveratrol di-O-methyltransferase [Ricinus communis]EEF44353.1 o-methyltransferase, putative [Ricinus communis]|eukprot:XP_002517835.1 trans-resveratrol di-O-methyltransferase [Ricinus communis]